MGDHYCCKRCGLRYDDCTCSAMTASNHKERTMATTPKAVKVPKPPKSARYYLEAFEGTSGEWFARIKSPNGNVINISEGYKGGKTVVKRFAQSLVNGTVAPVMRLNILNKEGNVVESWVFRPQQKSTPLEVTASTPAF